MCRNVQKAFKNYDPAKPAVKSLEQTVSYFKERISNIKFIHKEANKKYCKYSIISIEYLLKFIIPIIHTIQSDICDF